jgi:hypothetical protein
VPLDLPSRDLLTDTLHDGAIVIDPDGVAIPQAVAEGRHQPET